MSTFTKLAYWRTPTYRHVCGSSLAIHLLQTRSCHAETDPRHGTPTMAHFQPPDLCKNIWSRDKYGLKDFTFEGVATRRRHPVPRSICSLPPCSIPSERVWNSYDVWPTPPEVAHGHLVKRPHGQNILMAHLRWPTRNRLSRRPDEREEASCAPRAARTTASYLKI